MTGNTLEVESGAPVTVAVGLEELYPGPRTWRDTRCEEQGQRVRVDTSTRGWKSAFRERRGPGAGGEQHKMT